ncbi:reverse transcriptase domain-containing protein [Cerasicoccus maritimus]|uniref:reverse transcriptase domain-containing protein n=1 Tax=Cerasicoccus maritimus TaxID=490089 RepID=UPI002852C443|nr:reverse transcriptase domain-containing protein [Cerasicoccus maritimus]
MPRKTSNFIQDDYRKAFFPLESNIFYGVHGAVQLTNFINTEIFKSTGQGLAFLRSPVAFALKDKLHIRRVIQLDPISNYFLYDFVNNNRNHFSSQQLPNRFFYGYTFSNGSPVPSFSSYHDFRRKKYELKDSYEYFIKVDISNCFNSFYHHDITSFFKGKLGVTEGNKLGKFLREINGGESINFFPQGVFPAKALGNQFLTFIDRSREFRSEVILRFLDDIYFFSDNLNTLEKDIFTLQHLLANKNLFLNSQKTKIGSKESDFDEKKLDDIKIQLLQKRELGEDSDENEEFSEDEEEEDQEKLTAEEKEYLISLSNDPKVEEEDVELALSLLKEDPESIPALAEKVVAEFPNLAKNLYRVFERIPVPEDYIHLFRDKLKEPEIHQFELFWLTKTVQTYFTWNSKKADLLIDIYNHPSATNVVRAKIVEDEELGYGFQDLKENCIKNGDASLEVFSSISGLKSMEKGRRNQMLKYAAHQGPMHKILCGICSSQ